MTQKSGNYNFEVVHILNGKIVTDEEIDKYLSEKSKQAKPA